MKKLICALLFLSQFCLLSAQSSSSDTNIGLRLPSYEEGSIFQNSTSQYGDFHLDATDSGRILADSDIFHLNIGEEDKPTSFAPRMSPYFVTMPSFSKNLQATFAPIVLQGLRNQFSR